MHSPRIVRRCLVAAAVFCLCALGVGLFSSVTSATVTVIVRSEPSEASVFEGRSEVGATPVRLALAAGERRDVRLLKKGRRDAELVLDADDYIPRGSLERLLWSVRGGKAEVLARLAPSAGANLAITTSPDGATVFLDGQRVGITPFARGNLPPGRYAIRIEHPECFPISETVVLRGAEHKQVRRKLRSKVEAYYRARIASEPGSLMHHTDLAHYFVLKGDFHAAIPVLKGGFEALKRADATDDMRYFDELYKIYTNFYAYPDKEGKAQLRALCRELAQEAIQRNIGDVKRARLDVRRMDIYDRRRPSG